MQIPHRVCSFIWRLTHQCLPTNANLISGGIPCADSCVCCDLLVETHMQLFFVCSKAVNCWEQIDFYNIVLNLVVTTNDFASMFLVCLTGCPHIKDI
jgi:hypothetical protein